MIFVLRSNVEGYVKNLHLSSFMYIYIYIYIYIYEFLLLFFYGFAVIVIQLSRFSRF